MISTMHNSPQRIYVLKFGGKTAPDERIEIRNGRFELMGNCLVDDQAALSKILGLPKARVKTLFPKLMQQLSVVPSFRFTNLEL